MASQGLNDDRMHRPGHFSSQSDIRAIAELNDRSREIFRQIVESYLVTGEPVGSRNLARILPMALSPASIRNVMSDLETAGLIFAPHTSAGRLPTESGLRFFVDAMMEIGDVGREEGARIEAQMKAAASGHTLETALAEASSLLSGVSRGAGVVVTSKSNPSLKHIEFVRLDPSRALVVLVGEDGSVENRVLDLPPAFQRARWWKQAISSMPIFAARPSPISKGRSPRAGKTWSSSSMC
jgi:heat-inducible transcriptional repressor